MDSLHELVSEVQNVLVESLFPSLQVLRGQGDPNTATWAPDLGCICREFDPLVYGACSHENLCMRAYLALEAGPQVFRASSVSRMAAACGPREVDHPNPWQQIAPGCILQDHMSMDLACSDHMHPGADQVASDVAGTS